MRVYYLSDIHNDYHDSNHLLSMCGDVEAILVIAGDINSKGRTLRDVEVVADRWKEIIVVLGNHDWWGLALHEWHKFETTKENVHVLNNSTLAIGDTTFVGTTLWHPIVNHYDGMLWYESMNDRKKIRGKGYRKLKGVDIHALHVEAINFIKQSSAIECKKILITHHALSDKSLGMKFTGDKCNKFYSCNNPNLLKGFNAHIHGHIHNEADYYENGCNVVCNPKGYNERENPMFGLRMIETDEI